MPRVPSWANWAGVRAARLAPVSARITASAAVSAILPRALYWATLSVSLPLLASIASTPIAPIWAICAGVRAWIRVLESSNTTWSAAVRATGPSAWSSATLSDN